LIAPIAIKPYHVSTAAFSLVKIAFHLLYLLTQGTDLMAFCHSFFFDISSKTFQIPPHSLLFSPACTTCCHGLQTGRAAGAAIHEIMALMIEF
jgi:hypothetical protein